MLANSATGGCVACTRMGGFLGASRYGVLRRVMMASIDARFGTVLQLGWFCSGDVHEGNGVIICHAPMNVRAACPSPMAMLEPGGTHFFRMRGTESPFPQSCP